MKMSEMFEQMKEMSAENVFSIFHRIVSIREERDADLSEAARRDRSLDRRALKISESQVAALNRIGAALERLGTIADRALSRLP